MSDLLFEHNQAAYDSALAMLAQTGKAAVIHPTGTGKSFIAFKLCEDHPEQIVCWLSPSEYIFRTQKENWKRAGGGESENIRFFTYAKLMLMESAALAQICPDFIILDEFHRCGAEMWGKGVQSLLQMYPDVPVLGLSATNIRYLDNQRDMADELFDGNIASEMSLGEAIVRGILNPPKYVLSVFSYQKELEEYQRRIHRTKSKAARDAAGKYLDALRRALEKADGLDEIFAKHMTDRSGKYIVFCAGFDHMHEMIEKAPEWFAKVDKAPHIYSVYSDNAESSKAFSDFKEDNSGHLKLLFCIDMLNEGVHVEDVSGVVLLRPTVSPIVYKQQIGRALCAGKKKDAVIFDIVLNIENLYSIGAIEEEMQIAATYYRCLGMENEIVNERFCVVDEVRDCRELFEKLSESLTVSWDLMYAAAKRYYEENGNLEVPRRYLTAEGYSLGAWLNTQRRVYAKKINGILTDEQIVKLNAIGMRWGSVRDLVWEKYYAEAEKYYKEHGNLLVNVSMSKANGLCLGRWIAQLRVCKKNGIRNAYLTSERIRALEDIGMVWDVPDYLWEQNYFCAMRYYQEHGNLDVPSYYVSENGIRLGSWIFKLRGIRRGKSYAGAKLTEEQIARLDEIGMNWETRHDTAWEKSYAAACEYKRKHGNLDIPAAYMTEDGCRLGRWIRRQRSAYKTTLSRERERKLNAIGMVWSPPDSRWEAAYQEAETYFQTYGNLRVPAGYQSDSGFSLGNWIRRQRAGKEQLSPEQTARLGAIGMVWDAGDFEGESHAPRIYEAEGDAAG